MSQVPPDLRGAVTGFVALLCKGSLDDQRWDWDCDQFDWKTYQAAFSDPGTLKSTIAVFLNTLELDAAGRVTNYPDARFRGFQFFRALMDPKYPYRAVKPPFQPHEIEEPDWRVWEG